VPVQRLNHIVLYVSDARRTAQFYVDVLDFKILSEIAGGKAIFMRAPGSMNDHDLGLFELGPSARASEAGRSTVGMYHMAWEVDTLAELERIAALLSARGALVGASDHGTTKALYARDPDGLEFEVSWLVPAHSIVESDRNVVRPLPLDLGREKERFGADTPGGIGVSVPARV
jgi:catechol-2,3-dioxygenase